MVIEHDKNDFSVPEKIVSVITWIAFVLIVFVHLGILLAGIFYSSPEDVPVEFLNP